MIDLIENERKARAYYESVWWHNVEEDVINVATKDEQKMAGRRNGSRTRLSETLRDYLPQVSTHKCIDCKIVTAEHYHHWTGIIT